jgi:heptaprenyl diphosphate synthase
MTCKFGGFMTNQFVSDIHIQNQLKQVKLILDSELQLGDRYLNGSLDYVKASTGKMLRPTFLLVGATFGTIKNEKELLNLATAIEVLHTATLIHDDIIDEAKLRRGKESIQSKYSKEYAVYMGDFLLSRCFMMLSNLDIDRESAVNISKAVNKVCIGEMKQNVMRYDVNITPAIYFRIIARKTAALFALSLGTGASFADVDKTISKKLARIGYHIGMTFQMVDDLLDFEGESGVVGKEVRSDIIRGNYSLPLIYALQSSNRIELV